MIDLSGQGGMGVIGSKLCIVLEFSCNNWKLLIIGD